MTDQVATIPNGWKEKTLAEAVEIIDGDRGVNYPQHNDFSNSGYCVFLSTKNIPGTKFDFSEPSFISERKDEKLRKGKLERGDFVLTTRGTIGNYAYFSNSIPYENIRINSGMVIMRPKEEILDRGFFNAYLASYFFQAQIKTLSSGTAQPQLPIRDLSISKILLPSIPEQHIIAAVLSPLDNKIELLREQNKTLEAVAKAIFKEWFVNFDFPGQDEKPYKSNGGKMIASELGEIPERWIVGTVNCFIERNIISYRCIKSDLSKRGKTPIIDQGADGLYGYTEREPDFQASSENPVILFTNHTCNMWFVNYPFCAIQNVIPFRGNSDYSTFFVYYMTLGRTKFIEYKGHWPDFEQKKYVIPTPELANKFAEIVKPLQHKIWSNNSQIQTLSNLRDTLSPKLLKGEMRLVGLKDKL